MALTNASSASMTASGAIASETITSRTFPLFQLPRELQDQVFDNLCNGLENGDVAIRKDARTAFLLASKTVYRCFAPRFYQQAVFHYAHQYDTDVDNCFSRCSDLCLRNITTIRITFDDGLWQLAQNGSLSANDEGSYTFALLSEAKSHISSLVYHPKLRSLAQVSIAYTFLPTHDPGREKRFLQVYEGKLKDPWTMESWEFWWFQVMLLSDDFSGRVLRMCEEEFPDFDVDPSIELKVEHKARDMALVAKKDFIMPKEFGVAYLEHMLVTLTRKEKKNSVE